ncbi:MAG: type 2 lantipeptide synthetase LanM, partial [Flavobacteriaceae bacterium]|nr:type 2 lantipeptide synthetase LanM [Flavobacteriaceae bacterium]
IGLGDFHSGTCTAIVELSNNKKIVYKPTDGKVTEAYYQLLDWINNHYSLGNYRFKILNREKYQWLEFVEYDSCQTTEDLETYYKRAGFIIGLVYLLNGCDYHYENIIANGSSPVLIDHETIIQPKISEKYRLFFRQFIESSRPSVLDSFLLPNKNTASLLPKGMCGLGYHKQTQFQGIEKVGVNRFSDDWKMSTHFVTQNLFKNNIPLFKGKKVYPKEYLKELLSGFEFCYRLLTKEKTFLLSSNSPLKAFNNTKVRFIWRPTSVYARIFNRMKLPENLKNTDSYEKQIKDYLFVAFKKVPKNSSLNLILKSEINQMLKGDIPYFEANTSSRDLHTEFGVIENFFDLSCIGNLKSKLKELSQEDLEFQKKLIAESILS